MFLLLENDNVLQRCYGRKLRHTVYDHSNGRGFYSNFEVRIPLWSFDGITFYDSLELADS